MNFFSGTPASNRRELRLHLNVVPTGAGVFKSRHILLHKYVNRIPIYGVYLSINKIFQYLWFLSLPRLMLAASRKLLNQGFQVDFAA
jgi:hypothetical protein